MESGDKVFGGKNGGTIKGFTGFGGDAGGEATVRKRLENLQNQPRGDGDDTTAADAGLSFQVGPLDIDPG